MKTPVLDLLAQTRWEIATAVCPKCGSRATNFTPACMDDLHAVYLLHCVACDHRWWEYSEDN